MSEIMIEAKKLDFKTVESAGITWDIERFEQLTSDYEFDYGLFNDPKGGRIDRLDHEGGTLTGCFYLKW